MNNITIDSENIIGKLEHNLLGWVMGLMKGEIKNSPVKRLTKGSKSPVVIPFPEIENSFIVFYPPNSDHYVDKWDGSRKFCKILDGTIYESTEKSVYSKDDEFEIERDKKYDPYTLNGHCIAFVKKLD
jgi:hypothetical protein